MKIKKRKASFVLVLFFILASILPVLKTQATIASDWAEDNEVNWVFPYTGFTNAAHVEVELNGQFFGGKWHVSSVSIYISGLAALYSGWAGFIPFGYWGEVFTMQYGLWINNELIYYYTKEFFPVLEDGIYYVDLTFTDLDISGHILEAYVELYYNGMCHGHIFFVPVHYSYAWFLGATAIIGVV